LERLGIIWLQLPGETQDELPSDANATTEVRSLTIEAPPDRVSAEFQNRPLARIRVGDLPVIAAVQPLSNTETALHLVIEASVGATEQKLVSAWGAALRTRAEAS